MDVGIFGREILVLYGIYFSFIFDVVMNLVKKRSNLGEKEKGFF